MESELGLAVDALPAMIWIASPDGRMEVPNRNWLEYTGLSVEETLGDRWVAAVHPDDRSQLLTTWKNHLESGQEGEVEARLRRRDGVYRWFILRARPVRDASGTVLKWCGVNTDIEDHKRVEGAARAYEQRFRLVLDGLPAMVVLMKPNGALMHANRQTLEYTGLSIEDVFKEGWVKVVHSDDLPQVLAAWKKCFETGNGGEMEQRMRRHDGMYRWFHVRGFPLRDGEGRIVLWYTHLTDIDEHKRAEELLAGEKRFRKVVDGLPAMVVLVKPDGAVMQANRQTLEYTGLSIEEVLKEGWFKVVHPDDRSQVLASWKTCFETGNGGETESRMRRHDGVYRWFNARGFPLRDDQGRIVLWYTLLADIDERKRAEALLAGERRVLEMIARGEPLHAVLDALCQLGEEIDSECHSGILLVDPVSKAFQRGGASSRASAYIDAMQGVPSIAEAGPGATLATPRAPGFIEDVASADPQWGQRWRDRFMAHGWRACWGAQILSRQKEVLGGFAIYRTQPGTPSQSQRDLIGRLCHIASIAIERAHGDMAVKRSMEGFRAVVETTPECVKLVAHDGTLLQVNKASACIAGVPSPDVLLGKCFFDFVVPEHRQRYIEFHEAVCAGKRGSLEFDIFNVQGERRHMESYSAPMERMDGTVVQLGVTRDITVRRQAEADLRRRDALMAKAQRLSSSGSFSWRPEIGEIIWCEEVYRIFEIEPSVPMTLELIGSRMHPTDLHLMEDMRCRAQAGKELAYDYRLLMPDGRLKYLSMSAHAMRDSQGRLEYIGAVRDVTEQRQSEDALGQLRTELTHMARVNSLGALTASIAHEINQPLAGITTNTSTLSRMLGADPPNIEGAREAVRRTLRDARRASDVVTRLRALYSKHVEVTDSVDLKEAAAEVMELLQSEMRRNRIVPRLEGAEALPPVTGDRVQLQQVMLNLLLNAMEAMRTVEDRPRQLLIKAARESGGCVRFAVTDSGSGFDPGQAGKLFEAFYTTKREGMGIGLSVCRSIVESHGGRIWAIPNDGPGATFLFSIPCGAGRSVAADPADSAAAAQPAVDGIQIEGRP